MGGWYQLLSIKNELKEIMDKERTSDPLNIADNPACPNDGEPLITGINGNVRCTFCGYPYDTIEY